MKKRIALAVVAALLALGLTACDSEYFDPAFTTLRYENGATQGGKFVECIKPGKKVVTNDNLYPYPNTQREDVWDSENFTDGGGRTSADHKDLELSDKDGNSVFFRMKVSFHLNTSCAPVDAGGRHYPGGTLQAFHELISKTRKGYFNLDGSFNDGWLYIMNNNISSSAIDYLTPQSRTATANDMWLKPQIKDDFEKGLLRALPDLVNQGMETDLDFFKDFTVKIYSITPDASYLSLFRQRQREKVTAETAESNRANRVAKAKADAEVATANAKVKRAKIRAYGSVDAYLKAQMIQKGLNPYQPTLVGYPGATQ